MKAKLLNAFVIVLILLQAVAPVGVLAYTETDQSDYAPGATVYISGDNSDGAGFVADESVMVEVSGTNGFAASCTAVADANAAWACALTLPADAPDGSYSYVATGQTSAFQQSGGFTVTAPSTPEVDPTQEPTQEPTVEPTSEPTQSPTEEPSATPTAEPTTEPTAQPTAEPTATTVAVPPFIQSDKEDYFAGELVTLTSGNWQPGEAVSISVIDDAVEETWRLSVTIYADPAGAFVYRFNLPDWYVANYRVAAVGAVSGTARTTFTDSRIVNISGTSITANATTVPPAVSVTVTNGATISATVNVTTNNAGGNQNWRATGWRINTSPGTLTCVNHTNHDGSGTYSETFNITAPSAAGTYSVYFIAYQNDGCTQGDSNTFTLPNAVVVVNSTTTTVSSGANPSIYGNSVTFTATVSSSSTPTGSVNFVIDSGAPIAGTAGPTTASTAVWTYTTSSLSAGNHTVQAFYVASGSFNNSNGTLSGGQTVNTRSLTVTAAAANKTYDGTTAASVTLSDNRVAGDTFTTNFTSAAFDNKNVGTGKTVTVSGISISGGASANYALTSTTATTTANITTKSLTVTGITANNKTYDGDTTATLNTGSAALVGVVSGDVVTLNTGGATGTFDTRNVGTGKTVTVAGLTLSGADAGNYSLIQPTTTADITARELTVSGITADDKTYDGNTTATLNTGSAALVGVVSGDDVTLNTGGATGTFADKNAAADKIVSISGLTIGGADAGNYSLTQPSATADITALAIVGSITANNKTYDGTTDATIATRSLSGVISGDDVVYVGGTAAFADKNAGTNKLVTATGLNLSGTDAGNYTVNTTATTTADIATRALVATAHGVDKVYDGTADATVTFTDDREAGDDLTVEYTAASFADKNVGDDKDVSVTGISLTGPDSGNYAVNVTASTTANITPRHITGSFTANGKVYDGTTSAAVLTRSLNGAVSGDDVELDGGTATFDNKNVGTDKTVTLTGASLIGTDAGNYVLDSVATASANITQKHITGSFTADDKVYDGTTTATVLTRSLTGTIFGDDVSLVGGTAAFADKNVGTDKPVSLTGAALDGDDSGNYVLDSVADAAADITPKLITGSFTAANKVYDGNTSAMVLTRTLNGVVGLDDVSLTGGIATFDNKNAGVSKVVTLTGASLAGDDADNYALGPVATATADITQKHITGNFTAADKVYDGNTSATVLTRTLNDVVGLDDVSLTGGTAAFDNEDVGTAKTVTLTGASLSGADAGNYFLDAVADATASITALGLSCTVTVADKVYDGNDSAVITDRLLSGVVGSDDVSCVGGAATFNNKTAANDKPVSVTGLSLAGDDADNYTVNATTSTTASIFAKHITGNFTAADKIYDGNTSASVLTRTLNDIVGLDDVTLDGGTAAFDNKNAGSNKTVTLSGATLTGDDSGNYVLDSVATTTANITARHITGSFTAEDKIYDGTDAATILTRTLSGVIGLDDVVLSGGTATFADKDVDIDKTVTLIGAFLDGADSGNYFLDSVATATADIKPLHITGAFTADDKVYDGTTAATVLTRSLVGAISGDDVSLDGGAASFDNKNVGTDKTVSLAGASLIGEDADNYVLDSVEDTTADITALHITGAFTADDKVYDGNDLASVLTRSTVGDVGGVSLSGGVANFSDKNVGLNKTVTLTGATLTGVDAANYVLDSVATTTADITPLEIVGSITANDKIYDGSTAATISGRSLSGAVSGDDVSYVGGTATFDDKNVGDDKLVTATGLSLSGLDAGNYTVNETATTYADITPLAITGHITASDKIYDGNDDASILTRTLTGVVSGDDVSYVGGTANFDDKNVGIGKTVTATGLTLSGTDAGNYIVNSTAFTTANITARALTVSATADNKVYDGSTAAVAHLSDDRVTGDDLSLSYTDANFGDKNVGTGKTVTVTGISISGADASNYTFNITALASADITARALTITATGVDKVYDGNTNAIVTLSDDRVAGDVFNATYASAVFANKNVGTNKNISVSGISITGTDAGNYTFNETASATANITARDLTVSASGVDKVYDGNADATVTLFTNKVSGDVVTASYTAASFDDKNVGTDKPVSVSGISISGADSGNYNLLNTTASTTADITARALTVSAAGIDKVYDGTVSATVTLSDDRVSGDVFTATYGSAAFGDKNVGTDKPVGVTGISISGTDAGNYTANTTASTTADISARALTITAAGIDKVYDGTTAAAVTLSDNRVSGDVLTASYASAAFDNKNVGIDKPVDVTGISISGTDSGNYTFNASASTAADITVRTLHVTAAGINKVYDGNNSATVNLSTDKVFGDDVTATYTNATFADKNVGNDKVVTVTGISISGDDADNYVFNTDTTTTANISARALVVTAHGISKVYDGTTAASLTLTDDRVSGDVFTTAYTAAAFVDKNVGTGKTVNVSGISITGTDAGNYTFNTTASTTANITQRDLSATATADNKVYDGTTNAVAHLSDDRVSGDVLTASYAAANFNNQNVGTGKPVSVTGISISGADAGNYNLLNTSASTTANITARPVTVTADAKTKVYGSPDPALTYQVTVGSVISGDTFSGALTRVAGENVGMYAIQQNTLTLGSNYALSYVSANLTITKATLTVTADNKSKFFGDPDPIFTFTYSGFKFSDNATVIDTAPSCTVAVPHTAVNTYPITCNGGYDNNYSFNYVSGILTIGSWQATGFYQPVDMNGVVNTIRGGQTVPLKFELFSGSTELTSTTAVLPLSYIEVSCSTLSSSSLDEIETLATGGTSLRYDSTAGQFIYNWKTPSTAGKCYRVTMTAQDGVTKLIAYFKTK